MTVGGLPDAEGPPQAHAAPASTPSKRAGPPRAYRADIDGLRALAVVAVILTHAKIAGFSGGFLGVDVFFVISGYLIYRDLVARLNEGRLSLFDFYGRRLRRTLPALYLVAIATLAGAACVMMPSDLDAMARSLAATVLLVPNMFFLTQSGYFDAAAGLKPLLHTWSLGVEEQFYVLAPLLPLGVPAARRPIVLAILFVLSLAACVAMRQSAADSAFYLMPARVFEFLVGAALVEGVVPPVRARWLAETITTLALAALVLSIVLFTEASPLPGVLTLVPCLATAAIIHVGTIHVGTTRPTRVGALLGSRGPAFVGLISYSLYLWHWPILVLSQIADLPATMAVRAAQAVLLLGLSVLSWRYVEAPFRRPGSVWRRRAPMVIPVTASCLLGAAVVVVALNGLPGRFPPTVASIASYYTYRDHKPFREGQCFITSKDTLADFDRAACLKIVPGAVNVLLIGDSQAAQLWTGLRETWPDVNVLQATASGCRPLLDTSGAPRCVAMMHEMLDRFIPHHHLDAVVIGGLWEKQDVDPLLATITALKPDVGRIVVVGPMPTYDEPLPTLIAQDMLKGDLADVSRHRQTYIGLLDEHMQREVGALGIGTYVSPYKILCPQDRCRLLAAPGVPLQFDEVHLTPEGARVLMTTVHARVPALLSAP